MDCAKESLRLHGEWKGKIEVVCTVPCKTKDDLSLAYTPGVAQPCLEIQKDVNKSYDLTRRHNLCAVITLAGLQNALKMVGKKKEEVKIVTSGAGAAAIAIVKLLLSAGYRNITMCDRSGAIYEGREGLNWIKQEMAAARALADLISDEELSEDYIIPAAFDPRVGPAVAAAVAEAARKTGVARL